DESARALRRTGDVHTGDVAAAAPRERAATHRTGLRHRPDALTSRALLTKYADHTRNHVPAAHHLDAVAQSQIEVADIPFIMERGTRDDDAAHVNRIQHRDGR